MYRERERERMCFVVQRERVNVLRCTERESECASLYRERERVNCFVVQIERE